MRLTSLEKIYQAKAERRKRLAALPPEEKVRLMENLREMGRAMREARRQLSPPADEPAGLR